MDETTPNIYYVNIVNEDNFIGSDPLIMYLNVCEVILSSSNSNLSANWEAVISIETNNTFLLLNAACFAKCNPNWVFPISAYREW